MCASVGVTDMMSVVAVQRRRNADKGCQFNRTFEEEKYFQKKKKIAIVSSISLSDINLRCVSRYGIWQGEDRFDATRSVFKRFFSGSQTPHTRGLRVRLF